MEPDDAFHRAFRHACYFGDLPGAKEAIATGRLTIEDLDEGLKLSKRMRHVDIVTALFDAGIRVTPGTTRSVPGKDGQQGPRIVRLFLDRGMDPNAMHFELIMRPRRSTSSTPTPLRPSNGEPDLPMFRNPECAALLLEAGADPNRCGPSGIPPLGRAVISAGEPDTSLLELYIAHCARLEPSLLFYAVRPRVQQSEIMTRFLLDRGLDPNKLPPTTINLVKMLLEAGADTTVIPYSSRKVGRVTPAQAARDRAHHQESIEEILRLLESYSHQVSKQPS
ncbi:hypothetical protein BDW71DRAFT_215111 [Aspergillus fruticulosus]